MIRFVHRQAIILQSGNFPVRIHGKEVWFLLLSFCMSTVTFSYGMPFSAKTIRTLRARGDIGKS